MKRILAALAFLIFLPLVESADLQLTAILGFSRSNVVLNAQETAAVSTASNYVLAVVLTVTNIPVKVTLGDLSVPGYVLVKNIENSNKPETLYVAGNTNEWKIALKSGEVALFRLGTNTLWLWGTSAATNITANVRVINN